MKLEHLRSSLRSFNLNYQLCFYGLAACERQKDNTNARKIGNLTRSIQYKLYNDKLRYKVFSNYTFCNSNQYVRSLPTNFTIGKWKHCNLDLSILLPNLVPRACDPWEGNEGSGIIRCRKPGIVAKIELRIHFNGQSESSLKRIIPEPSFPSRGSQARGTRLPSPLVI